jgi:hypothetical protein
MRLLALALGIACLHSSQALSAEAPPAGPVAPSWQTFDFAPGRYQVSFPSPPVMQQGKLRSEIGEIVSTRHTADSVDATYDVTYNDYPEDRISRLPPEKLLDTVRDGLIYQSKGRLVSEKPFRLGKLEGREHEIAGEDGTHYRIRLLLVSNRLYQLTAMARPPALADSRKFFGSFRLTGVAPR